MTSANAAQAFGVYPRKGRVAADSDADVVVWNMDNIRKISSKEQNGQGDFNVFEGLTVHGAPEFVVAGGRVAVYEYQLNAGMEGAAKKVDLPAFPAAMYDAVADMDAADQADGPVDRIECMQLGKK